MIKKTVIVKAVAYDDQGKVLLIRRSQTAPRRPLEWDIPGGFLDKDDGSYREACLRELREETGIEATQGTINLGYTESKIEELYSKDTYDVSWLYFTVQVANTEVRLSYEHDKFTWVSLERAMQLSTYDRQIRALTYLQRAMKMTESK